MLLIIPKILFAVSSAARATQTERRPHSHSPALSVCDVERERENADVFAFASRHDILTIPLLVPVKVCVELEERVSAVRGGRRRISSFVERERKEALAAFPTFSDSCTALHCLPQSQPV